MIKFQNFMINSYLVLESMWESGLVWRPRPPNKVLDLWPNFGPLRAKISQIAWGTPTFYCTPRLYLPIGIQNSLIFVGAFFFIFGSGQILSGDLCRDSRVPVSKMQQVKVEGSIFAK